MKNFIMKVALLLTIAIILGCFVAKWFVVQTAVSALIGMVLGQTAVFGALIWNKGI